MLVYNNLRLAFDGQSRTSRSSPGGALTLTHPVIKVNSSPRCLANASFHYSLSPRYLRFYMSLVVLLYKYSQHDRSCSFTWDVYLVLVGFQISFVEAGFVVFYGMFVYSVSDVVAFVTGSEVAAYLVFSEIIYLATCFAFAG
jgi:hypothetical protein